MLNQALGRSSGWIVLWRKVFRRETPVPSMSRPIYKLLGNVTRTGELREYSNQAGRGVVEGQMKGRRWWRRRRRRGRRWIIIPVSGVIIRTGEGAVGNGGDLSRTIRSECQQKDETVIFLQKQNFMQQLSRQRALQERTTSITPKLQERDMKIYISSNSNPCQSIWGVKNQIFHNYVGSK